MDNNLDKQILDIQNLKFNINNFKLIDLYKKESNKQRMLLNKIKENADTYKEYVNLSKKDLEKIEYGYLLLNQIDLDINNLVSKKSKNNKIIPFSFRSFGIFILIILLVFIYYFLFIF
jgi:hypothetical protein